MKHEKKVSHGRYLFEPSKQKEVPPFLIPIKNLEKQGFSPLGTKNMVFDGFGCQKQQHILWSFDPTPQLVAPGERASSKRPPAAARSGKRMPFQSGFEVNVIISFQQKNTIKHTYYLCVHKKTILFFIYNFKSLSFLNTLTNRNILYSNDQCLVSPILFTNCLLWQILLHPSTTPQRSGQLATQKHFLYIKTKENKHHMKCCKPGVCCSKKIQTTTHRT